MPRQLAPTVMTTPYSTTSCVDVQCPTVVVDVAHRTATVLDLPVHGVVDVNPAPKPPMVESAPTGEIPLVEHLDASVTLLGAVSDGSRLFRADVRSGLNTTFEALWCEGPRNDASGCDTGEMVPMVTVDQGAYAALVVVRAACDDDCRIVVVDLSDLTRRTPINV